MKKILLSLVVLASSIFALQGQNNMVIHQGNGSTLSLPLQSIDSVRFNLVPPSAMKRIFQNNGNILSLSVADIDSITYTIPNRSTLPTLTTQAVTVLSSSSAFGGGNISADGGSAVTQRGVCWNTSPNPTLANNFTVDGTGLGSYGSTMQPLSPATTYYVRAYATNANGTSYGSQVSFVTAAANNSGSLPTISTNQVVYMDSLSAFCGGNITADGGLAVTARGVCWAIGTTPTINNSRTLDGVGGGNFNSRLPNLLPNTTYFVRAYATNAAGTAYGISFGFTTKGYATVVTDSVYDIMALSARAAGRVLSDGGVPVSERGFCWSYSPNPSVDDNKVLAGNGLGAFAQQIQSFADTLVYVRAFAGSSIGFSYGNQISFKTQTGIPVVLTDSVFDISAFTASVRGNVLDENGATLTTRGFCWGLNPNPTINDSKTNNGNGVGVFTESLSNLLSDTIYYIRAYAETSIGFSYGIQISFRTKQITYPVGSVFCSSGPTIVNNVINPITGKTWMDRNLGAIQVATSSSDSNSFGDLYQWGRRSDGHQCRKSDTTSKLSISDLPSHSDFIISPNNNNDWRISPNDNLWQGLNGTNNPCPTGYRIPTETELSSELASWNTKNNAGAFSSPLKFPMATPRRYQDGDGKTIASSHYWSSTGSKATYIFITLAITAGPYARANGFSVRCIKN